MSAPVFDLQARRAARPRDRDAIAAEIVETLDAMRASVAGWPVTFLRHHHIVGIQRQIVEISNRLIELQRFVPPIRSANETGSVRE